MVEAAVNESRTQMEDLKNLLIFLKLKEYLGEISLQEGCTLRSVKMKTGNLLGVNTILLEICKRKPQGVKFLGKNAEQRALTRQWLEYNITCLVGNPHHSSNLLRELDFALIPYTFLTGNTPCIADLLIYFSLYPTFREMSYQDKEKYCNLSRWFRLVQEYDDLRGTRDKIPFTRMPLYIY